MTFNGCAQHGCEDITKLHSNGSGTALLKDCFSSEFSQRAKFKGQKRSFV